MKERDENTPPAAQGPGLRPEGLRAEELGFRVQVLRGDALKHRELGAEDSGLRTHSSVLRGGSAAKHSTLPVWSEPPMKSRGPGGKGWKESSNRGSSVGDQDMQILRQILEHAQAQAELRDWGADGAEIRGFGAARRPLNAPLVEVLKSYETVLRLRGIVPSEDTFFYRLLLKMSMESTEDWWSRFESVKAWRGQRLAAERYSMLRLMKRGFLAFHYFSLIPRRGKNVSHTASEINAQGRATLTAQQQRNGAKPQLATSHGAFRPAVHHALGSTRGTTSESRDPPSHSGRKGLSAKESGTMGAGASGAQRAERRKPFAPRVTAEEKKTAAASKGRVPEQALENWLLAVTFWENETLTRHLHAWFRTLSQLSMAVNEFKAKLPALDWDEELYVFYGSTRVSLTDHFALIRAIANSRVVFQRRGLRALREFGREHKWVREHVAALRVARLRELGWTAFSTAKAARVEAHQMLRIAVAHWLERFFRTVLVAWASEARRNSDILRGVRGIKKKRIKQLLARLMAFWSIEYLPWRQQCAVMYERAYRLWSERRKVEVLDCFLVNVQLQEPIYLSGTLAVERRAMRAWKDVIEIRHDAMKQIEGRIYDRSSTILRGKLQFWKRLWQSRRMLRTNYQLVWCKRAAQAKEAHFVVWCYLSIRNAAVEAFSLRLATKKRLAVLGMALQILDRYSSGKNTRRANSEMAENWHILRRKTHVFLWWTVRAREQVNDRSKSTKSLMFAHRRALRRIFDGMCKGCKYRELRRKGYEEADSIFVHPFITHWIQRYQTTVRLKLLRFDAIARHAQNCLGTAMEAWTIATQAGQISRTMLSSKGNDQYASKLLGRCMRAWKLMTCIIGRSRMQLARVMLLAWRHRLQMLQLGAQLSLSHEAILKEQYLRMLLHNLLLARQNSEAHLAAVSFMFRNLCVKCIAGWREAVGEMQHQKHARRFCKSLSILWTSSEAFAILREAATIIRRRRELAVRGAAKNAVLKIRKTIAHWSSRHRATRAVHRLAGRIQWSFRLLFWTAWKGKALVSREAKHKVSLLVSTHVNGLGRLILSLWRDEAKWSHMLRNLTMMVEENFRQRMLHRVWCSVQTATHAAVSLRQRHDALERVTLLRVQFNHVQRWKALINRKVSLEQMCAQASKAAAISLAMKVVASWRYYSKDKQIRKFQVHKARKDITSYLEHKHYSRWVEEYARHRKGALVWLKRRSKLLRSVVTELKNHMQWKYASRLSKWIYKNPIRKIFWLKIPSVGAVSQEPITARAYIGFRVLKHHKTCFTVDQAAYSPPDWISMHLRILARLAIHHLKAWRTTARLELFLTAVAEEHTNGRKRKVLLALRSRVEECHQKRHWLTGARQSLSLVRLTFSFRKWGTWTEIMKDIGRLCNKRDTAKLLQCIKGWLSFVDLKNQGRKLASMIDTRSKSSALNEWAIYCEHKMTRLEDSMQMYMARYVQGGTLFIRPALRAWSRVCKTNIMASFFHSRVSRRHKKLYLLAFRAAAHALNRVDGQALSILKRVHLAMKFRMLQAWNVHVRLCRAIDGFRSVKTHKRGLQTMFLWMDYAKCSRLLTAASFRLRSLSYSEDPIKKSWAYFMLASFASSQICGRLTMLNEMYFVLSRQGLRVLKADPVWYVKRLQGHIKLCLELWGCKPKSPWEVVFPQKDPARIIASEAPNRVRFDDTPAADFSSVEECMARIVQSVRAQGASRSWKKAVPDPTPLDSVFDDPRFYLIRKLKQYICFGRWALVKEAKVIQRLRVQSGLESHDQHLVSIYFLDWRSCASLLFVARRFHAMSAVRYKFSLIRQQLNAWALVTWQIARLRDKKLKQSLGIIRLFLSVWAVWWRTVKKIRSIFTLIKFQRYVKQPLFLWADIARRNKHFNKASSLIRIASRLLLLRTAFQDMRAVSPWLEQIELADERRVFEHLTAVCISWRDLVNEGCRIRELAEGKHHALKLKFISDAIQAWQTWCAVAIITKSRAKLRLASAVLQSFRSNYLWKVMKRRSVERYRFNSMLLGFMLLWDHRAISLNERADKILHFARQRRAFRRVHEYAETQRMDRAAKVQAQVAGDRFVQKDVLVHLWQHVAGAKHARDLLQRQQHLDLETETRFFAYQAQFKSDVLAEWAALGFNRMSQLVQARMWRNSKCAKKSILGWSAYSTEQKEYKLAIKNLDECHRMKSSAATFGGWRGRVVTMKAVFILKRLGLHKHKKETLEAWFIRTELQRKTENFRRHLDWKLARECMNMLHDFAVKWQVLRVKIPRLQARSNMRNIVKIWVPWHLHSTRLAWLRREGSLLLLKVNLRLLKLCLDEFKAETLAARTVQYSLSRAMGAWVKHVLTNLRLLEARVVIQKMVIQDLRLWAFSAWVQRVQQIQRLRIIAQIIKAKHSENLQLMALCLWCEGAAMQRELRFTCLSKATSVINDLEKRSLFFDWMWCAHMSASSRKNAVVKLQRLQESLGKNAAVSLLNRLRRILKSERRVESHLNAKRVIRASWTLKAWADVSKEQKYTAAGLDALKGVHVVRLIQTLVCEWRTVTIAANWESHHVADMEVPKLLPRPKGTVAHLAASWSSLPSKGKLAKLTTLASKAKPSTAEPVSEEAAASLMVWTPHPTYLRSFLLRRHVQSRLTQIRPSPSPSHLIASSDQGQLEKAITFDLLGLNRVRCLAYFFFTSQASVVHTFLSSRKLWKTVGCANHDPKPRRFNIPQELLAHGASALPPGKENKTIADALRMSPQIISAQTRGFYNINVSPNGRGSTTLTSKNINSPPLRKTPQKLFLQPAKQSPQAFRTPMQRGAAGAAEGLRQKWGQSPEMPVLTLGELSSPSAPQSSDDSL